MLSLVSDGYYRMRLKQTYWDFRAEISELWRWCLCSLPAGIGIRVRARAMRGYFRQFGADVVIQENFRVTNPGKVAIGDRCNFARGVFIAGGGGVDIGNCVGLGPDTKVWSVNHRFDDPHVPWLDQGYEHKPVVIHDDVWLGANCFVMPGVTIGKGAIVSAGSVLMKSVPAFAVVAGNPARVVSWRKKPVTIVPPVVSAMRGVEMDHSDVALNI